MKIGIVGCAGRMGRMLVAEVLEAEGCTLAGGTEHEGSHYIGDDVAELAGGVPEGLAVGTDAKALFACSQVVIDFTTPEATLKHALLAADQGVALVVGTTGFSSDQQEALQEASQNCVIVQAANMSFGVNLLLGLVRRTAETLGQDYDIEIVEMHHRHKVDAPSGTALSLGEAAAGGRKVALDNVAQKVREGYTGPRKIGDIGFATLRGGDVVGDHKVTFAADGERIELTHKASSRTIFARGAVKAALWTKGREPGLYSLIDVLGL
jgi:4-hydroxy-tetrahydrodipicolinate reductase